MNTTQTPLPLEMDLPENLKWKIPLGINGLRGQDIFDTENILMTPFFFVLQNPAETILKLLLLKYM